MGFIVLLKFSVICIDLLAWPVLGLVYPLLASIRAIESCSKYHLRKLAIYWTVFSLISLFEFAFVMIIEWIPFWSSIKLVVTIWLVLPKFDGACVVYECIVRPWLLVNLRAIMERFYEPKEEKLHNIETFLDVADKYIKENGYEALEKLISIKRDRHVLDNPQRDILVLESEENVVAAVSEQPAEQVQEEEEKETASSRRRGRRKKRNVEEKESDSFHSSSSTTLENLEEPVSAKKHDEVEATTKSVPVHNSKPKPVAAAEIQETPPPKDARTMAPPMEKIKQEWNCVLCQVKTTCEKNLNMHLRGKNHKLMCDSLKGSFNQNKGKQVADKGKPGEGSQQMPHKKTEETVEKQNANQPSILWCNVCKLKLNSKADMAAHVKGRRHSENMEIRLKAAAAGSS